MLIPLYFPDLSSCSYTVTGKKLTELLTRYEHPFIFSEKKTSASITYSYLSGFSTLPLP